MLNKRISKNVINKVISYVVVGLIALSGVIFYSNHKKIESLEKKLELKQQIENQKSNGYTRSIIDVKTIQGEFNKLQDYSILKDYKVSMNHTYTYNKESILGLHKKGVLNATANCLYDIDVRLSESKVYVDDNGVLNVQLEKPFINENSVHYENNSMIINEEKTNMLFNKEDGKDIMKYWINSFNTSAIEQLKDYYSTEYQQDKLKSIAKQEVKELINTLGIDDMKINITINN